MNRITSISDFEAPQANIALSEPFAVQLAADMAFLTHDALKELQEQTELFELVSFPAPYHVKLLLVEGSAQLDITDARQRTIACKAAMSDLKSTIENYVKAVQKTEFCSRMSADEATATIQSANVARQKGGYATMMAFRREGLSMDPKTAEALFGVIAFTREQIIDRSGAKHAPQTSMARH